MEVEFDIELELREWNVVDSDQNGDIGIYNIGCDCFEASAALVLGNAAWEI